MKISAIDIGTNTLLMVIGEQISGNSNTVRILHDIHSIARLGEGVDRTGIISETALERATAILHQYSAICQNEGVERIEAVATSAVRDAVNGKEVCNKLSSALKYTVRIISGEEESYYSFTGTDESLNKKTIIDIGGGSTEYVTGINKTIQQRKSLQIGAVRLHERYLKALPPSQIAIETARMEIRNQLSLLPQTKTLRDGSDDSIGEIIGVGGTFTTLAAIDLGLMDFDSTKVHNHTINAQTVSKITHYLLSNSLASLLENPAIHPQRADILPAGALILDETLKFFNAIKCKASTKGLRYGVLYDAFGRSHSPDTKS